MITLDGSLLEERYHAPSLSQQRRSHRGSAHASNMKSRREQKLIQTSGIEGTVVRTSATTLLALVEHPGGRFSVVEWYEGDALQLGDRMLLLASENSHGAAVVSGSGRRVRIYCHLRQASADDAFVFGDWRDCRQWER